MQQWLFVSCDYSGQIGFHENRLKSRNLSVDSSRFDQTASMIPPTSFSVAIPQLTDLIIFVKSGLYEEATFKKRLATFLNKSSTLSLNVFLGFDIETRGNVFGDFNGKAVPLQLLLLKYVLMFKGQVVIF